MIDFLCDLEEMTRRVTVLLSSPVSWRKTLSFLHGIMICNKKIIKDVKRFLAFVCVCVCVCVYV